MGGDRRQAVVTQDAATRDVAPHGLLLAPERDRLQDRQVAPVLRAWLQAPPGLGRVDAVGRRVGEDGYLLLEPVRVAALLQARLQFFVGLAQMGDVGERVGDVTLAQRPRRPVGEAQRLVRAMAGEPADQCLVPDMIAEPAHHRRDLGVEQWARYLAGHLEEDLDVLPRRVHDLRHRFVGEQIEQGCQVDAVGEGVDGAGVLGTRDLDETDLRPEGRLAHELGVDGDVIGATQPLAERGDPCAICDEGHRPLL